MSRTDVIHPIMAALLGAEEFLGKGRVWQPKNNGQRIFLERLIASGGDLSKIPEMKTKAAWTAAEINAFLKDNGFTIELQEFGEGEFGVASLMKMLVEWLQPGRKIPLKSRFDGKNYDGVRLSGDAASYRVFNDLEGKARPYLALPTKSGDTLCMLPVGDIDMDDLDLMEASIDVICASTPCYDFEGAVFPMVDLDESKDLDWLLGMKTKNDVGDDFEISQAVQQSRLKMNQHGAKMESAVAIGVRMTTAIRDPKPPLVIDEPFLFWAERPGLKAPYFTAYVTQEAWKDPGDIGIQRAKDYVDDTEV